MNAKFFNTNIQVRVVIAYLLLQLVLVPFVVSRCLADESINNQQATTQSERVNKDVARMIEESKIIEATGDIESKTIVEEMIANSKALHNNTTSDCEADVTNIISTSEKAMKTHGSSGMLNDLDMSTIKSRETKDKKATYLSDKDDYSRYIFISSSMPKQALKEIFEAANKHNALIVVRGFKNNSYTETHKFFSKFIEEFKTGFVVDPELFGRYAVDSVPTFILSQEQECSGSECMTPMHDRIIGNVGVNYAFEVLAKDGEIVSSNSSKKAKERGVQ